MRRNVLLFVGIATMLPAAATAGWTVMGAKQAVAVAKSGLTVTPVERWNRWSRRPSTKGEVWTKDGMSLNEISFFAGIANGSTLYKETNKKDQPLPRFSSNMLIPDIVQMFETSNRILLQTSLFAIDSVEPSKLAGHDGVHFTYHYTVQSDEVRRKGEARAAIIDGKLYLISFVAPALHYYDADVAEARAIMNSAKL